jgi:uncharacterized protein (TIGR00251 family)
VKTNAKKSVIIGSYGDGVKIAIKAPAIDNKANNALIEFLSEHYQVKKSQVEIVKGLKSNNKLVQIDC